MTVAADGLPRSVATLCGRTKHMAALEVSGVRIPDSMMARELTRLIRDTESDLLFHHSTRVYFWGALTGTLTSLRFDPE
jgi:hypothetical protein